MNKKVSDYPQRLRSMGLELLEPFTKAKTKHLLKCLICNHQWRATPISKLQAHKKHGSNGCPVCHTKRSQSKKDKQRQGNIDELINRGFKILSNWDGRRVEDKLSTPTYIEVQNTNCNHIFKSSVINLLSSQVSCPTCNDLRKREAFQQFNIDRQEIYQETASEWDTYRHEVYSLTRKVYALHENTINPNNHPRGKAGVEGAYQLDHIVSVRYCFDNDIPASTCSHSSNLQMLEWKDNLEKYTTLPEIIPPIFSNYL